MKRTSPFDTWPLESHDASYGFRWYREPAILIDHLTATHGTVEVVRAMHASLDATLAEHRTSIEAAGGLFIIGDWRHVTSYDPAARQLFLAELRKPRPIRGTCVILSKTGAFLRMAVQAARMASVITGGPSIAVSDDINAVLAEHGIRSPARTSIRPPGL
jgi:hypothetical protein